MLPELAEHRPQKLGLPLLLQSQEGSSSKKEMIAPRKLPRTGVNYEIFGPVSMIKMRSFGSSAMTM